MVKVKHLTMQELEDGLAEVRQAPAPEGVLEMIVRRPSTDERERLDEGELDVAEGLVGDNWRRRGSSLTPDKSAHPDMQLTIMNARLAALVAQDKVRIAGNWLGISFIWIWI